MARLTDEELRAIRARDRVWAARPRSLRSNAGQAARDRRQLLDEVERLGVRNTKLEVALRKLADDSHHSQACVDRLRHAEEWDCGCAPVFAEEVLK